MILKSILIDKKIQKTSKTDINGTYQLHLSFGVTYGKKRYCHLFTQKGSITMIILDCSTLL